MKLSEASLALHKENFEETKKLLLQHQLFVHRFTIPVDIHLIGKKDDANTSRMLLDKEIPLITGLRSEIESKKKYLTALKKNSKNTDQEGLCSSQKDKLIFEILKVKTASKHKTQKTAELSRFLGQQKCNILRNWYFDEVFNSYDAISKYETLITELKMKKPSLISNRVLTSQKLQDTNLALQSVPRYQRETILKPLTNTRDRLVKFLEAFKFALKCLRRIWSAKEGPESAQGFMELLQALMNAYFCNPKNPWISLKTFKSAHIKYLVSAQILKYHHENAYRGALAFNC